MTGEKSGGKNERKRQVVHATLGTGADSAMVGLLLRIDGLRSCKSLQSCQIRIYIIEPVERREGWRMAGGA
jgi:hypothetical protein